MTSEKNQEIFQNQDDYQYGFKDEGTTLYSTNKGISREVVEEISHLKNEPDWVLEYRLKAYEAFEKMDMPSWGPDLSDLDFAEYTY